MRPGRTFEFLKEVLTEWSNDEAERLAASLAFYLTLSIAPFLFVIIGVAGLVLDGADVRRRIFAEIERLLGPGATAIQAMLEQIRMSDANLAAAVLGGITLLLGASGVVLHLRGSLNTVWGVRSKPGMGPLATMRRRFLSLAMLLVTAFMLLVTLVFGAMLRAGSDWLSRTMPALETMLSIASPVAALVLTAAMFAVIFKYLPEARVSWRDVWLGAAVTTALFTIGRILIGLYLGRGPFASAYGAAGSFVIVLFWVYYSSQILFLGAEFTQVWARRHGRPILPNAHAVSLWTIDAQTGLAVKAMPKKKEDTPEAKREKKEIAETTEPQRTAESGG